MKRILFWYVFIFFTFFVLNVDASGHKSHLLKAIVTLLTNIFKNYYKAEFNFNKIFVNNIKYFDTKQKQERQQNLHNYTE